jgi:4-amino-4-deoxy-L-arabinose transferase-like glycosyltransferase
VPAAIVLLAAVLRLWGIKYDAQNPFYDAAVRSMGTSWHNFFFGAFDPGGALAIDKPPIDLWLQVASTKVLGFNRTALALPEALGGIAAVAFLYAAVTRAFGALAGALAALTLALLPISVLTSRSDTMDSLMSALLIAALWSAIVAVQSRRARWILLSAALVGVAFDVKLAEALVPLPALALLWWVACRRGRRLALGAAAACVLIVTAMAWAFVASLTPRSERPFPIGSRTGSIYKAIFVFNGIERLTASGRNLAPVGFPSSPGATRLVEAQGPDYASLIGVELLAALAFGIVAVALSVRGRGGSWLLQELRGPPEQHAKAWIAIALAVWLGVTYVLFSFVGHLQPRYLEAMSPALASVLGISAAYLIVRATDWSAPAAVPGAASRRAAVQAALAIGVLALAAVPAKASIDLIARRVSDANPSGSGSQYSAYLRAHREGARYETAANSPLSVAGLIMQDAQPVLVMRDVDGKLVSLARLQRLVKEGAVRYIILPKACTSGAHCSATTSWSVSHAVKVAPGLYRYEPPAAPRGR